MNRIGENAAYYKGERNIMTVDLSTKKFMFDWNNNHQITRVSITRIIAHEFSHSVLGTIPDNNATVIKTDAIMKSINNTRRATTDNYFDYEG
ncbi:hypothetical protein ACMAZF_05155 [Psychrobium sp. nBUS_13]|uniref:hypothetical protein n=1 Tax=Psychrobium sp. nBUS_13 TaxID=3395319 RepID=UPI003EBB0BEF